MRFDHPLDTICDRPVNVRILRYFCRHGGEWNGRRVAAELGLDPVTTHAALRRLHEATVLEFRKMGNNFIYSLRQEHYLVRYLLRPLFQREHRAYAHLGDLIKRAVGRRWRAEVVTVALYGSLARRQERPRSDLDLLVLVTNAAAKAGVERALDRWANRLYREFYNPASPYVNTVAEARRKVRQGLPLFRNILAHHDVLWGQPLKEVLRGRTP